MLPTHTHTHNVRTQVDKLAAPDSHGEVPLRHSRRRELDPHFGQLGLGVHARSSFEEAAVGWQGDTSICVVGWWGGRVCYFLPCDEALAEQDGAQGGRHFLACVV